MTNREIAAILGEAGTLLELRGENPFKCRAYHNASRVVGGLTADLRAAAEESSLTDIPGIGKGLAAVIADLVLKGRSEEIEELRASFPPGLPALLGISGLGPKKVKLLHERLGIVDAAGLRKAALAGTLSGLPGFGPKSADGILKGLELLERSAGRRLLPEAEEAAARLAPVMESLPGVRRWSAAGSLRRRSETVGDLDFVAAAPPGRAAAAVRAFAGGPGVKRVLGSGGTRASVLLAGGQQCDLRVVSPAEYPFALQYFTGSREHNVALRGLAGRLGWSMNEYGFTPLPTGGGAGRPVKRPAARRRPAPVCRTEEEIYRALGLAFIPPELREATGEIEAARDDALPTLIGPGDLRGAFHCHTTWSDGRNTLPEMAAAARTMGWEYLGIADHSKAAAYARGLREKDVERQIEEIRELNGAGGGFRILAGTEVDILGDGTLDWSDAVLRRFDYVVASVHSRFGMTEREATRRIVRALTHPRVTMLGHPTGRLLLERDGYPLAIREVIDAAADHGKAIEINANPRRLDLDPAACRYAREKGVPVAVNPDAHSVSGLSDVRYGVDVARKGWLGPGDVLNARSLPGILRFLNIR